MILLSNGYGSDDTRVGRACSREGDVGVFVDWGGVGVGEEEGKRLCRKGNLKVEPLAWTVLCASRWPNFMRMQI